MGSPEQEAIETVEEILGFKTSEFSLRHTTSEDRRPQRVALSMQTTEDLFVFVSFLTATETDKKPGESVNRILLNKFLNPLISSREPLDNPLGYVFLDLREMRHLNSELLSALPPYEKYPREYAQKMGSFRELNRAWIRGGGIPQEEYTSRFGLE